MNAVAWNSDKLTKTVVEARRQLLKRDAFAVDIPTGYGLSYPVPRPSSQGVVTACFLYGAPATPPGTETVISRPRFWFITPPRESRILLFADCRVLDFASGEYCEQTWPRPDPAASSMEELLQLEDQLLTSLDAAIDTIFGPPEGLEEGARSGIKEYGDLIKRLTPQPLHGYLHDISPQFWAWAESC